MRLCYDASKGVIAVNRLTYRHEQGIRFSFATTLDIMAEALPVESFTCLQIGPLEHQSLKNA
jgi:hypothetical protein